jgi:hypothetical protein
MPRFRVPIGNDGPVIDLAIWIDRAMAHSLVAQGLAVPPPQTVRELIDTSADRTAIHPAALAMISSFPKGRSWYADRVLPQPLGALTSIDCMSLSVVMPFRRQKEPGSKSNPPPSFPPTPVTWP